MIKSQLDVKCMLHLNKNVLHEMHFSQKFSKSQVSVPVLLIKVFIPVLELRTRFEMC